MAMLPDIGSHESLRHKISLVGDRNKPLSEEQKNRVINSYSEPWRHYHNCDHILNMFNIFEESTFSHRLSEEETQAIQLMIIFHDDTYKLSREKGWNERESAKWAMFELSKASYELRFADMVWTGVVASTTHSLEDVPVDWHNSIGMFLDIDLLAGLGTTWEEFIANTKRIEREFEPLYTASEYQAGRIKWAENFLTRDKIFQTPGFAQYESVAQENLQRLIAGD